jgi:predicted extracellular nuclease
MKYWFLPLIATILLSCNRKTQITASSKVPLVTSETEQNRGDLRMVTYNVENLFDTKDDTLKDDNEFLPNGMKNWNYEKYTLKIRQLYKVIANIGGNNMPDILCLTEIENKKVLKDLIERTPLNDFDYGVIHEESPDPRGIDVGLLYRKTTFIPLKHNIVRIKFPFDTSSKTRDILMVDGLINNFDTVHIFVCHFPSRRGGEVASEPRRNFVASQLRIRVDSLFAINPDANIIITGDFNDEPTNTSIFDTLNAKGNLNADNPFELYNFMYDMKVNKGLGTYKFQGYWNMLDHYIVSRSLITGKNKLLTPPTAAAIYMQPWLEQVDDEAPGTKPFRTYGGPNYYGGYSDHFPIYLDIFFQKP